MPTDQPVALASHQSSLFDLSEMTFKYYLENQYSLSFAASAGSQCLGGGPLLTHLWGPVSGKGLLSLGSMKAGQVSTSWAVSNI